MLNTIFNSLVKLSYNTISYPAQVSHAWEKK